MVIDRKTVTSRCDKDPGPLLFDYSRASKDVKDVIVLAVLDSATTMESCTFEKLL